MKAAADGSADAPPEWLRSAAKVSLHDHLDGSLRPATLLDLAARRGIALPVTSVDDLRAWVRAGHGSLEQYLRPFALIGAALQDAEALYRVAVEYVADAAADGIIHAEVRWAPTAHTSGGLSHEGALEAVAAGLSDGVLGQQTAGRNIDVTQILCILRGHESGHEVAQLALGHRDRGVVAIDLAGDEARHPVHDHTDVFTLLAAECMPVTIHAGEAAGVVSVKEALLDGRAIRIGHGVRIAEDLATTGAETRLGRVAAWVRDRDIALETSPSSNLHTGAVTGGIRHHPVERLRALGFTVTVNTDNRLISETTLTQELDLVRTAFGYGPGTVGELLVNAAQSAFLPPAARNALAARVTASLSPHDHQEHR
jgi:adenosine deaminase